MLLQLLSAGFFLLKSSIFRLDPKLSQSQPPLHGCATCKFGPNTNLVLVTHSSVSDSIIGLVTPDMLESITWGTYIFFAAFCLLALAFTIFCVPETRGKVSAPLCHSLRYLMLINHYRRLKTWISSSGIQPPTKKRNASSTLKPSCAALLLKTTI